MPTISFFIGDYRFLSNFYPCIFIYDGTTWPSVEHAYQAAKTFNHVSREQIRTALTAARAKAIGSEVSLRADWHDIRLTVMRELLALKYRRGSVLARHLVATHPALLIHGNHYHDHFWGAVPFEQEWRGTNWLGKLLMDRRAELIEEKGLFE